MRSRPVVDFVEIRQVARLIRSGFQQLLGRHGDLPFHADLA